MKRPADTLRMFWNLTREGESKTRKAKSDDVSPEVRQWSRTRGGRGQAVVTDLRGMRPVLTHLMEKQQRWNSSAFYPFPYLLDRPGRRGLIHPRTSGNS